ncbi:MAG: MarR family winged helix-turn-helix transcriptional regulator [Alphaproteobacteria bacterium]|nr:MarR family winged helix-turn-helix transcriptional regulator [Alphaproteobacteria bacterium]
MPDSQRADIGGTLYQLMRLMRRYWHDGVVASLDMTGPQSIVVAGLKSLGDGVNQTELSTFLAIHKAPLACIIDQLEQKGLVERRLDPHDRRVRRIFATELVREIHPRMELVMDSLNASLTEGLSNADMRTIDRGLETMRDNLLIGLGENRIVANMDAELI